MIGVNAMGAVKTALKDVGKSLRRAYKAVKREITQDRLYKYDTQADREDTVAYLLAFSQGQRQAQMEIWEMDENYYNNAHDAQVEMNDFCERKSLPSVPAVIPEPFVHCESQIIPEIQDFQFRGRDDDQDSSKARLRQYVVQYVLDNNDMLTKNTSNERRLVKLGDAVWKVFYDAKKGCGKYEGDISVLDVPVYHCFPDPVAIDTDSQEYHGYVYPRHRIAADREFAAELEALGLESVSQLGGVTKPVSIKLSTDTADIQDDVVYIVEWWFRQPRAGSASTEYEMDGKIITETVEWEAGDIACTIIVNDTELRYIPLYWRKTHTQNKMYPFAKYSRMPKEDSFWGRSEIEPMKELVDAADRELAISILNDQMMGNDIIIEETSAIPDGEEHLNEPGAVWKVNDGRINSVRRLGGLSAMNGGLQATVNFIRDIIKQVTGNFDVNMGDAPPANVNTLGGLLAMQDNGNKRQGLKKAGRTAGFERLYRLIDWTAIEFYDDNRLIWLGATGKGNQQPQKDNMDRSRGPVSFLFNSEKLKASIKRKDGSTADYWPIVDCVMDLGDGIKHSTGLTLQALQILLNMVITPQNWKFAVELIDKMQLPDGQELREFVESQYAPKPQPAAPADGGIPPEVQALIAQLPPEMQQHLLQNPQLLQEFMAEHGIGGQGAGPSPGSGLSPEEEAHLQQHPELIDQTVQDAMGGAPAGNGGMA